jgi:hypothetical protein
VAAWRVVSSDIVERSMLLMCGFSSKMIIGLLLSKLPFLNR